MVVIKNKERFVMDELQCLLIDNNLDIIKTIYKINHYDYSNKDIIYDIKENYNK